MNARSFLCSSIVFLALVGASAVRAEVLEYENPVWDGYLADPFAFKSGDTWYAIGTGETEDGKQLDRKSVV